MHGHPSHGEQRTETVVRALVRAFALVRRAMAPCFERFGISGAQWGVLRALQRAHDAGEEAIRLTDLSSRLLIQPPSVTTVVERLRRLGLVMRRVAAADQRAREIGLTQRGRRLVARVLARHPAYVDSLLEGLAERDRTRLHVLLDRLSSHLADVVAHRNES